MNNVVLTGRLAKDVDLRYTQNNNAVASFTLAVDRGLSKEKKKEAENAGYPTADFINIVVYGGSAEFCNKWLCKGLMACVQGRLQVRTYDNQQGEKKFITEVVAFAVEPLEYKDKKQNQEQQQNNDFQEFDGNPNIPF